MKKLKLEMWPTAKPIPYGKNPRKIGSEAVQAVAGSISSFGFRSPIIVDKNGVIINGHTRLLAAKYLDLATVPVIVADDLTAKQVQAFRLADNRVAEFSEWDQSLLMIELGETTEIDMSWASFENLIYDSDLVNDRGDETKQDAGPPKFFVKVECENAAHQESVFARLSKAREKCVKCSA